MASRRIWASAAGRRAGQFLLLFLALVRPASPAPASGRFVHFTAELGLSQNTVRAIHQDRLGMLWFASEEGLNRFDGYSFSVFKTIEGDDTSLQSNSLTSLLEDRDGIFWIGSRAGLIRFDPKTERSSLAFPTRKAVLAVIQDRNGTMWLGTDGEGLYHWDPVTMAATHYVPVEGDASSLGGNTVRALLEDKAGRIWIGTDGGGLNVFDREHDGFIRYVRDRSKKETLGGNNVWSLAEDTEGRIWVGTQDGGAALLDVSQRTFRRFTKADGLPADFVSSVYVDPTGVAWLGTTEGLARFVPERAAFAVYTYDASDPGSIGRNAVRAIRMDAQGNLWAATYSQGLSLLQLGRRTFRHLAYHASDRTGLSDPAVDAFLEDRAGRLWVGTGDGTLHQFNPDAGTFARYHDAGGPILALYEDHREQLWIATWGAGVYRCDRSRRSCQRYAPLDDPTNPLDDQVWSVTEMPAGVLWFGTDAGVARVDVDAGHVEWFRHDAANPHSLANNEVRALRVDGRGRLWVGNFGGVDRWDGGGHFSHFPREAGNPKSLSDDMVISLFDDARGRLWVGTFGGGVNVLDESTGHFRAYREKDGLPSNTVHAVLEDAVGRLWLSTNKGLCRLDPRTGHIERFDLSNGLESLHFNPKAALRAANGFMLFGSESGFYYFDPASIAPNKRVPPITFTDLKVLGDRRRLEVALPRADKLTLRYQEAIFQLEFAVLDYTFPRRNSYAYRLEGVHSDWVQLANRHDVSFANLAPGDYVLRIRGSNSDGVWDEAGRQLQITITPPWWATWWFRTLVFVLTAAAAWWAHRRRIERLVETQRELQAAVDAALSRVKILQGLLPVCASCKRIRDDRQEWIQMEEYIRERSQADFTHGICPECIPKYYGRGPERPA